MKISIFPLGAGQEVGWSCILLNFNQEKRILLDVGIHMGYQDKRKYPNFNLLEQKYQKSINDIIDIVLVTHFHLDHCAALPILTEEKKYKGKIYSSAPTKAIMKYMLKDFINVTNDGIYNYNDILIDNCISKVSVVHLKETIEEQGVKITPYYAGHVLGAVMFLIEYKGYKVLYTGDYNTVADRHLWACEVDQQDIDILISESTYGTIIRDWKKKRELQFMQQVKETFDRGGKVLIPVFALGRAQEFIILIQDLWKKNGWKYPVYFSSALSQKVNFYYNYFITWMNDNIKNQVLESDHNPFDSPFINKFDHSYTKLEQPMIVLATPGMLHGGTSMAIFREWSQDSWNWLIVPGYCVKGTLGNVILSGAKKVHIKGKQYDVNIEVSKMSFSAHADNRGIVWLVEFLRPQKVVFVHGEKKRMGALSEFIQNNMNIECFCPKNFEFLNIYIQKQEKLLYKLNKDSQSDSVRLQDLSVTLSEEQLSELDVIDQMESDGKVVEKVVGNGFDDQELIWKNILVKVKGQEVYQMAEFGEKTYFIVN